MTDDSPVIPEHTNDLINGNSELQKYILGPKATTCGMQHALKGYTSIIIPGPTMQPS